METLETEIITLILAYGAGNDHIDTSTGLQVFVVVRAAPKLLMAHRAHSNQQQRKEEKKKQIHSRASVGCVVRAGKGSDEERRPPDADFGHLSPLSAVVVTP
jgi:hypothetical protein